MSRTPIKNLFQGFANKYISTANHSDDFDDVVAKTVFVVGNGLRGKLGLGYQRHIREVIKHDELPDNMTTLCCGEYHTVSLTNSNNVCTWGSNIDGQLGYDTSGSNDDVTFFDIMKDSESGKETLQRSSAVSKRKKEDPLLCELSAVVPKLIPKKISTIVATRSSTFALTNNGYLYAWGSNREGELGTGEFSSKTEPTLIQFFEGSPVKMISAGGNHIQVIVENGDLYAWGRNKEGQLCLTDLFAVKEKFAIPQEVIMLRMSCPNSRIKKMALGNNHSINLLNDGGVLVWGENVHGQLGLGDNVNRHEAVRLKFENLTVMDVHASHSASYVLVSTGGLYVFGKCDHGQLGIGPPDTELAPYFKNQNRPILLKLKSSIERVFTSAVSDHVFIMTRDHKVYSFGDNEDKECCVKDEDVVWAPRELTNLKREDKKLLNIVTGNHCTFIFYE